MLNVMKKDGHIEVFDTKKIQEAILASARKILSNEEEYDMQQKALIIANEVARFLNSTEDENAVIMTSKIHNVVLEILSPVVDMVKMTEIKLIILQNINLLHIICYKYSERNGIFDLSFDQIHGDSRYNPGKQKEVKERVKHNLK